MQTYEIGFSYNVPEWSTVTLDADTPEQAEDMGREHAHEAYPDVQNIEIDFVREIKN